MTQDLDKPATAAAITLIILQTLMLFSLFTRTAPHPPEMVAPFGIAPFLTVSLCLAASALILGLTRDRAGRVLGILAALAALVSYGPHKYIDAQIGAIWPAVVAGQIAAAVLIIRIAQAHGHARNAA